MAECHAQARILLVYEMRNLYVVTRFAIATVARQHEHVLRMTCSHCTLHWYRVDDATIKHRYAVYVHYLAHIRQRSRSTHNVECALAVVAFGEIHRTTRETVGCDHLERSRIVEISVVIERHILVRHLVVEQFGIEDAALREQIA